MGTGPADPVTRPHQAQFWGLGRVAALERPGAWGGLVDLPDTPDATAEELLAGVLAAGSGEDGEDQVAIRGGTVHARRLAGRAAGPGALRSGGTPGAPC
ncbi:hypothetical protein [Actinomadura madurae]|uniref:hypothetical protein n=1 Tax=Actinomadura madurae TaxID=1993 RepID=UPI003558ED38